MVDGVVGQRRFDCNYACLVVRSGGISDVVDAVFEPTRYVVQYADDRDDHHDQTGTRDSAHSSGPKWMAHCDVALHSEGDGQPDGRRLCCQSKRVHVDYDVRKYILSKRFRQFVHADKKETD